jgi:hypothetical protein
MLAASLSSIQSVFTQLLESLAARIPQLLGAGL